MRGSHAPPDTHQRAGGSIPARAGEPRPAECGSGGAPVYPARAGEPRRRCCRSTIAGVYPRPCGGPSLPSCSYILEWVYPRPCGGAASRAAPSSALRGLSPPVRGSRLLAFRPRLVSRSIPARAGEPRGRETQAGAHGSIPARAGEPAGRSASHRCPEVYPRPCGGAQESEIVLGSDQRSIPARAGEPR